MRSKIKTCLGAALIILILSGCKPPPTPVQRPAPAPKPVVQKPVDIAVESWREFVADARAECEKNPTCTLDYDKTHEHQGHYYGVMVVGYRESEYYVDLYRFDPKADKWIGGPRTMTEVGIEDIDYAATSKQWNVPEATIRQWTDLAARTVKEIYSKRQ